jgi:hypothetical protein
MHKAHSIVPLKLGAHVSLCPAPAPHLDEGRQNITASTSDGHELDFYIIGHVVDREREYQTVIEVDMDIVVV